NRVIGPDFQWRPTTSDVVTGQWLYSATRAPNRADLSAVWTGRTFGSGAGQLQWSHNTTHLDVTGTYKDIGAGFRADTGFIPQVSPSRRIARIAADGAVGQEIDFANARLGRGSTLNLVVVVNPTNHLELELTQDHRSLNVGIGAERLFTARVSRLRGTY